VYGLSLKRIVLNPKGLGTAFAALMQVMIAVTVAKAKLATNRVTFVLKIRGITRLL
jgi:hypothetical protein